MYSFATQNNIMYSFASLHFPDNFFLFGLPLSRPLLTQFVERHVITRMVLKCSVPYEGVYSLKAMQSDKTHFTYDRRGTLYVNKHSRVVSDDILTSNGVLYKIDHVLPCSCERGLRNIYGQYISSYRYRKPYY